MSNLNNMSQKLSIQGEKNQNIKVFVRCRPINEQERKARSQMCADVNESRRSITVKTHHDKTFTYDGTFGKDSTQIDVYKTVVQPLISEVLQGYNCTVFAYGQTGTGKTYTMEGVRSQTLLSWQHDPHAGIVPRALHQIFSEVGDPELTIIKVSFLELYNEELFDLLGSGETQTSKLKIFEDATAKGSVVVKGLEEVVVRDRQEVYSLLERGASRRQVAATLMNATSSRSHTIFTITVISKDTTDTGEGLMRTGKLNLVDLAGSENIGRSGAHDKRAREAGNINQSLLTLGRVITALVERTPHVPYRESKLTRLLQDSLGGRTKTSIIATISPAHINIEETLSTLDYAYRAKNITNRPEVNQKLCKEVVLKHMTDELEQLRRDLIACREKNGFYIDETNYRSMQSRLDLQSEELQKKADEMTEMTERTELLQTQIDAVNRMFEDTQKKLEAESQEKSRAQTRLKEVNWNYTSAKVMIKAHQQTEEKLQESTTKLISTADLARSDIEKLQEKVRKQQEIEEHNNKVLVELTSVLASTLDSTGHKMEDVYGLLGKSCDLEEKTVDGLLQQGKLFQDVECLLGIIVKNHLDSKERFLNQMGQIEEQASGIIAELKKSSVQFNSSVDQTLSRVTGVLCFDLLRQTQDIRESLDKELGCVCDSVTSHKETMNTFRNSLHEQLDSISTKTKENSARISKNTESSKQSITAQCARLENVVKTLDSLKEEISSGLSDLQAVLKVQETINDNANQITSSVTDHTKSLTDMMQQFSTTSDEMTDSVASKVGEIQTTLKEAEQKQDALVKTCLEDITKDLKLSESKLTADTEAASTSVNRLCEIAESGVKESESGTEKDIRNYAALARNMLAAQEIVDDVQLHNNNLKNSALRIIECRIKRYESTGGTPGRRSYEIPRGVAKTQPAALLQEKLQKKLDNATTEERAALDEGHSILLDVTATPEILDYSSDEGQENNCILVGLNE